MQINKETREKLINHILTIEQIESEQSDANEFKKQKYAEMKGEGFDIKAVREIVKMRKKGIAQVNEEQSVLEVYLDAINTESWD